MYLGSTMPTALSATSRLTASDCLPIMDHARSLGLATNHHCIMQGEKSYICPLKAKARGRLHMEDFSDIQNGIVTPTTYIRYCK